MGVDEADEVVVVVVTRVVVDDAVELETELETVEAEELEDEDTVLLEPELLELEMLPSV